MRLAIWTSNDDASQATVTARLRVLPVPPGRAAQRSRLSPYDSPRPSVPFPSIPFPSITARLSFDLATGATVTRKLPPGAPGELPPPVEATGAGPLSGRRSAPHVSRSAQAALPRRRCAGPRRNARQAAR
ncbi:MAG: hypothetical protein ACRDYD_08855 [Acidimicrobiales bacterium]